MNATTIPAGLPVSWVNELPDDGSCTIEYNDDKTQIRIAALAPFAGILRAFVDMPGVDASATCEIQALPQNLTPGFGAWGDPDVFTRLDYQVLDRLTYIKEGQDAYATLVYNPNGNSTSLFLDARLAPKADLEPGLYTLVAELGEGLPDGFEVSFVPNNNENNQLMPDGGIQGIAMSNSTPVLWLTHTATDATLQRNRLITFQVRRVGDYQNTPFEVGLRVGLYKGEYHGPFVPYE